MDFCFDLESFGSGLFARGSWMLADSGRHFLEPESHAALAVLPFHLLFHNVCPVLKVHEEQNVPNCFKCAVREERNYLTLRIQL